MKMLQVGSQSLQATQSWELLQEYLKNLLRRLEHSTVWLLDSWSFDPLFQKAIIHWPDLRLLWQHQMDLNVDSDELSVKSEEGYVVLEDSGSKSVELEMSPGFV